MKSRNAFLMTACLLALLALAIFAVPALAQDETPPAEPEPTPATGVATIRRSAG